jgi:hypothetical protein
MKRIKILVLVLSSISFTLFAQQRTIMGTILDSESMMPLVGVAVVEDGTNNGCTTDIDGIFSLRTTNDVKYLVLSYIGYEKRKIEVIDKSNIGIITLDPKALKLNDITITAQLAVPRRTPVASSTVYANKIDEHLGNNIILLTLGGSWAYGTNIETSDVDIRGIALNSKEEILTNKNFEQRDDKVTDTVVYSFNKIIFYRLFKIFKFKI